MQFDRARLERTLNPKTIAVVGDKGPNYQWTGAQKEFNGDVWSVQVDENEAKEIEARGVTNFKSLRDIPGEVDLVICAVPRAISPFILADAIQKGVGGMSMFTSGFAETGEPEGNELQDRIVKMALDDGMPIVGPNCVGIYNRRLGLKSSSQQEQGEGGVVSIVSQSGTYSGALTIGLQNIGVKVSRTVSIGNAVVLNECDYLEYLLDDEHTEVIAMYLEGVRDGRRFFDLLRRARGHKPVVIWRGGMTTAGERAVHSHTASLASSGQVWDGLMRQTGAVAVNSVDEVIDTTSAFVLTTPSTKRNLALVAMTGGHSVAITDAFDRAGFQIRPISKQSYAQMAEFFHIVGGSFHNPFDAAWTVSLDEAGGDNVRRMLDILAEEPATDGGIAIELRTQAYDEDPDWLNGTLDLLDNYRERTGQPVIALLPRGGLSAQEGSEEAAKAQQVIQAHGLAHFPNFKRGAEAFGRVIDYYAALKGR